MSTFTPFSTMWEKNRCLHFHGIENNYRRFKGGEGREAPEKYADELMELHNWVIQVRRTGKGENNYLYLGELGLPPKRIFKKITSSSPLSARRSVCPGRAGRPATVASACWRARPPPSTSS